MSVTTAQTERQSNALGRLINRDEVLQICYWYQGEGFGEVFSPTRIGPFLACEQDAIDRALKELAERGYMEWVSTPTPGYRFTSKGKKEAGRLFAESFADFQKTGHGECNAGCCDGDDHSQCGDDCTLH